jgi:hypothetical protein
MRALVAFAALGLGTAVFMPTGISPGKNYLPNPQSKSLRQPAILARETTGANGCALQLPMIGLLIYSKDVWLRTTACENTQGSERINPKARNV